MVASETFASLIRIASCLLHASILYYIEIEPRDFYDVPEPLQHNSGEISGSVTCNDSNLRSESRSVLELRLINTSDDFGLSLGSSDSCDLGCDDIELSDTPCDNIGLSDGCE